MPRLSIVVSNSEHDQLRLRAAAHGQSIEDFMLSRSLDSVSAGQPEDDQRALEELETILAPRIERALAGEVSDKSISQIAQLARKDTYTK